MGFNILSRLRLRRSVSVVAARERSRDFAGDRGATAHGEDLVVWIQEDDRGGMVWVLRTQFVARKTSRRVGRLRV